MVRSRTTRNILASRPFLSTRSIFNILYCLEFYKYVGFLTGVLQNHARKFNIPIDTLSFVYKMNDYDEDDPKMETVKADRSSEDEEGVLVRGLFMEGARWDKRKKLMQDSFAMEMYSVSFLL